MSKIHGITILVLFFGFLPSRPQQDHKCDSEGKIKRSDKITTVPVQILKGVELWQCCLAAAFMTHAIRISEFDISMVSKPHWSPICEDPDHDGGMDLV